MLQRVKSIKVIYRDFVEGKTVWMTLYNLITQYHNTASLKVSSGYESQPAQDSCWLQAVS